MGIKLEQKVSERLLSSNHIHFMFQIWYFLFLFCVLSTELTVRNHLFGNVTINVTPQDLHVETELLIQKHAQYKPDVTGKTCYSAHGKF